MAVRSQVLSGRHTSATRFKRWLFVQRLYDLVWSGSLLLELSLGTRILLQLGQAAAPVFGLMVMVVYGVVAWIILRFLSAVACQFSDQRVTACDQQI